MTAIPQVIAALVSLYQTAITDAQVIDGPASSTTVKSQKVITVSGATGTSNLDSMSLGTTGLQYAITVTFSVSYPGGAMSAVRADADTMWRTAEQAVREHPTGDLGVPGVLSAKPQGDFDLSEYAEENVRSAAYRSSVLIWEQDT